MFYVLFFCSCLLLFVSGTRLLKTWADNKNFSKFVIIVFLVGVTLFVCSVYGLVGSDKSDTTVSTPSAETSSVSYNSVSDNTISDTSEKVKYASLIGNNTESNSATFTLNSGEVVTYYLPEGHYNTTKEGYDTFESSIGYVDRTAPIFFTGSSETMYGSEQAINCAPLSALLPLISEDVDALPDYSVLGPTAYRYMKTGVLEPDVELEVDYKLNELVPVRVGDITYHVYEVSYKSPFEFTNEEGELVTDYLEVKRLDVFSDTEDPVEINVYTGEYNAEVANDLLLQFLGLK